MTQRAAKHAGYATRSIGARVARTKGDRHMRGKLWRALRILRNTTACELMAVAEQDNKKSVQRFLQILARAGFVRARHGNRGRHEPTTYVLVRNSGPACPSVLQRGAVVYDHNTEQEYRIDGTE